MIRPLNMTIDANVERELYSSTLPDDQKEQYSSLSNQLPATYYVYCKDLNIKVSVSGKLSGALAVTAAAIAFIAPLYFSFALVPIALISGVYCAVQVGRAHKRQQAQERAHKLQSDINAFEELRRAISTWNQPRTFKLVSIQKDPDTQEESLQTGKIRDLYVRFLQLNTASVAIMSHINLCLALKLSPESNTALKTLEDSFEGHVK